ncbi:MAG: 23S rRNA (uracil(1939)-C(5))-methyltransferase RlmD [Neisseriaceae bacterium]
MEQIQVTVESIDAQGKGIARFNGKTIFINDVLPEEEVLIEIYKKKPSFDLGRMVELIKPSPDRVKPVCPNFGICGGCSLQHFEFNAQLFSKQKVLIDNLKHIGKVEAQSILSPISGNPWQYRNRARMSARYVPKKNSALVGFREKSSVYVVDMQECHILPKHISNIIPQLRQLISSLSIKDSIPQIEVAVGDRVSVLVFRIMKPLLDSDQELIHKFITLHNTDNYPLQIWLQPKGPDSCYPFAPLDSPKLSYSLSNFNIEMPFHPTEFTQINPKINIKMVELAVNLLELNVTDEIFDFFCGIGNFTLPIATKAKSITGIELNENLVSRAKENAVYNKLDHKTSYIAANLFTIDSEWLNKLGKRDKWLIDPPRDGAVKLIESITPEIAPQKIVYISCNPATLARDAAILVNIHGYTLRNTGVINMFPHTSHVESIAEFVKIANF